MTEVIDWHRSVPGSTPEPLPEPWFLRELRASMPTAAPATAQPAAAAYADDDLGGATLGGTGRSDEPAGERAPRRRAAVFWPALGASSVVLVGAAAWWLGTGPVGNAPVAATAHPATRVGRRLPAPPAPAGFAALCGRQDTVDGLGAALFEQARRGAADRAAIEQLASRALVRIDNPRFVAHDAATGVTACAGTLAVTLPGTSVVAPLLAAVEYAIQPNIDARGYVYDLRGSLPLLQRLAGFRADRSLAAPAASPDAAAAASAPVTRPEGRADEPPGPATAGRYAPAARLSLPRDDVAARLPADREPADARSPWSRDVADAPPRSAEVARSQPPGEADSPTREPMPYGDRADAADGSFPQPSFDCRGARTYGEMLVCTNDRLAALDRELASTLDAVVERGDGRAVADADAGNAAFQARRARCQSTGCVGRAYRERLAELDTLRN